MARFVSAVALVVAMSATAWAQDVKFEDEPKLEWTDASSPEHARLLGMPSFGLRAGYIKPRDADDGTWFGGVQLRVPLGPSLAIEGSIEFHTSEFADGDIEVVQYPVQVSLVVFLIPGSPVCPYLLGGVGWYYTRTSFDGDLANEEDETDSFFGGHLGVGVAFGPLTADVRYLFIEPDGDNLDDEDFDSYQFVLSLSFGF